MEVSPEELQELMHRPGPREFRLVDVRTEGDFLVSRLDWAELLPLSRIARDASSRLIEKDVPLVLYCRDGQTAHEAATILQEQEYQFVFVLAGGLEAWRKKIDPSLAIAGDPDLEPEPERPRANSGGTSSRNSYSAPRSAPSPPGEVSPEELQELISRPGPRDFRLIDVREEDEFQICRLDWAELIPLAELTEQAPRRLVDKDRPIVVYCHHGMRSQNACERLRRMGYEHVFNLTGGINAWADRVEPTMRRY